MSRPLLRSIEWLGEDRCLVRFAYADEDVEAVFVMSDTPVGHVASASPNPLDRFEGNAEEVRAVNAAIIQFCIASRPDGGAT